VENRAGAGGVIGCDAVAKSPADGYTFLFTISTPIVQAQALYKKLPYDPDKDFTFIAAFDSGHLPLAVHRDVPARGFREFVEFAKKTPVNFGSYGPGSVPHMVAAQINKLFGSRIEVVHFKGEAAMWLEVAAGRIHAAIGSISALTPHLQGEAVRPIAVNTAKRSPSCPRSRPISSRDSPRKCSCSRAGWPARPGGPAGGDRRPDLEGDPRRRGVAALEADLRDFRAPREADDSGRIRRALPRGGSRDDRDREGARRIARLGWLRYSYSRASLLRVALREILRALRCPGRILLRSFPSAPGLQHLGVSHVGQTGLRSVALWFYCPMISRARSLAP